MQIDAPGGDPGSGDPFLGLPPTGLCWCSWEFPSKSFGFQVICLGISRCARLHGTPTRASARLGLRVSTLSPKPYKQSFFCCYVAVLLLFCCCCCYLPTYLPTKSIRQSSTTQPFNNNKYRTDTYLKLTRLINISTCYVYVTLAIIIPPCNDNCTI